MLLTLHPLPLTKRYPLTISRGTTAASHNLLVTVTHEGVAGMGEFSDVGQVSPPENAHTAREQLTAFAPLLETLRPWDFQRIENAARDAGMGRAAFCALDLALHDWQGKKLNVPVYQMLGADRSRIVPSSLTIGINPVDVVRERTREIVASLKPHSLKIKLGSPEGVEHDRAIFRAVQENAPDGMPLRVDANGGWQTIEAAQEIMRWLADCGAEYVEQPLSKGREDELPALFAHRPLPIFADESCGVAADVVRLADRVDGVNLKLMKAGGIREGLRVIHTARACGLGVMMGCMSESPLAIAGSVAISSYADYLDLDSHLNIVDAPFDGLVWQDGRVLPGVGAGLGVHLKDES